MTETVEAFVYTIGKFVTMFFSLQIDPGVSVGHFLVAVAILGAVIRLIFNTINVSGVAFTVRNILDRRRDNENS